MSKILVIDSDDWSRVYIDKKIISDGHSIDTYKLLRSINGKTIEDTKIIRFENWDKFKEYDYPEDHFDDFAEEEKDKFFN